MGKSYVFSDAALKNGSVVANIIILEINQLVIQRAIAWPFSFSKPALQTHSVAKSMFGRIGRCGSYETATFTSVKIIS